MTSFDPDTGVFESRRVVAHPPATIFQAFARPERLARWWGPSGFTNTFEIFEFRPGGRWKYVMRGPKGSLHPNESVFLELAPARVVIHHVSNPRYVLTVAIVAGNGRTEITWRQEFENAVVAARLRPIVELANEQNLDRLASILAEG